MTVVPREPVVGPFLEEVSRAGRALETVRLADQVEMLRCELAFRTPGPYPLAPWGRFFDDPGFQIYRGQEFIVCRLERVTVLGDSGLLLNDGVVLSDTLPHLMSHLPGSNVESFAQKRSVRLASDLPVTRRVSQGRFFVGFTASWQNYARWLQECLPNLVAFLAARRRDAALKAIVPRFATESFQQQTLALLGVMPEMLFELDPDDIVTFDDCWVATRAQSWGGLPHVTAAAAQLADGVFQQFAPEELGGVARGERLYLSRRNAKRTVVNFVEVKALVERHGFEIVEPDDYSLAQQIAMMRRARHVIAEHGAGMANILFCRPGASVLELFNPSCVHPEFWSVASACQLRFGFMVGDHPPGAASNDTDWHANYTLPLAALQEAISKMSSSVHRNLAGTVRAEEQNATAIARTKAPVGSFVAFMRKGPLADELPVSFYRRALVGVSAEGLPTVEGEETPWQEIGDIGDTGVEFVVRDPVYVSAYFHFIEIFTALYSFWAQFCRHTNPVRIHFGKQFWNNPELQMIQEQIILSCFPKITILERGSHDEPLDCINIICVDRSRAVTQINKFLEPMFPLAAAWSGDMRDRIIQRVVAGEPRGLLMSNTGNRRQRSFPPRCGYVARTAPYDLAAEAETKLLDVVRRAGFHIDMVDFASMSFANQLAFCGDLDLLLGVYGSGLTNLFWLPRRAAVVEIFPSGMHAYDCQLMCDTVGLEYLGIGTADGVQLRNWTRIGPPGGNPMRRVEDISQNDLEILAGFLKVRGR